MARPCVGSKASPASTSVVWPAAPLRSRTLASQPPASRSNQAMSMTSPPRCVAHCGSRSDARGSRFIARSLQQAGAPPSVVDPPDTCCIDILGIGQGMCDLSSRVPDCMLQELDVPKGGRRVITLEERAQVLERLGDSHMSAGGSLANTLVGVSRLGAAAAAAAGNVSGSQPQRPLRIAMGGAVGSDALGAFFRAQLAGAGVEVVGGGAPGAATGTVIVLSTPDAQRSFLSYFASEDPLTVPPELEAAVARARVVVLEGYLWELPGADAALPELVAAAKRAGALVALTAGDAGVVARHRPRVMAALAAGVDLLFTNAAEAAALAEPLAGGGGGAAGLSAEAAAKLLASRCPMVVVTDGSKGSYLTAMGALVVVPPHWMGSPPVDTTGAGDAYAAGLLFSLLRGDGLHRMGQLAARTASAVISQIGPQLVAQDAERLLHSMAGAAAAAAPAPALPAAQWGRLGARCGGAAVVATAAVTQLPELMPGVGVAGTAL